MLCFPSCTAGIALIRETAASRCSLIELCNVPSNFTEGELDVREFLLKGLVHVLLEI